MSQIGVVVLKFPLGEEFYLFFNNRNHQCQGMC